MLACVQITFYLAQWEEYHTGTMSCGNGYFGVTEGQFVLMLIHLVSAMWGIRIWDMQPVAEVSMSIRTILLLALITSNLMLSFSNVSGVLQFDPTTKHVNKQDRGKKHDSKFIAVLQILPIVSVFVCGGFWISGPDAPTYARYPVLYLFALGLSCVFLTSRMIVSHMCKVPYRAQLRILVPLYLLLLNGYSTNLGIAGIIPTIHVFYAALAYTGYIGLVYSHYMIHVVTEICHHLDIYLLRLPRKEKTT